MKNFKLLLATTAILSTGAMLANADFHSAPIGAVVNFASPAVATKGDNIFFGTLDPAAGGTLTVKPDGTFTGTAKVINNGGGVDPSIQSGSIKFSGGTWLPGAARDSYSLDAETNTYTQDLSSEFPDDSNQFLVKLALDGAKINMYKGDEGNSSNPSCGYVDNLTQGNASWDGTYYTLRIGGTLNLDFDDDYADSDGSYDSCSGKTTVTYVLQEWR